MAIAEVIGGTQQCEGRVARLGAGGDAVQGLYGGADTDDLTGLGTQAVATAQLRAARQEQADLGAVLQHGAQAAARALGVAQHDLAQPRRIRRRQAFGDLQQGAHAQNRK